MLEKNTHITEKVGFQIRAEFFNILNSHYFTQGTTWGQGGAVVTDLGSPLFGTWTGAVTTPPEHTISGQVEILMDSLFRPFLVLTAFAAAAAAQTEPRYVEDILKEDVLPQPVAQFQLRQYILQRVGKLPAPSTAAQWTAESKRVREQILSEVVYHGWPKEWINSAPKFEETGQLTGEWVPDEEVPVRDRTRLSIDGDPL